MPQWGRPELPDGPLRELNEELHRLHAYSGHRSSYQIAKWLKARAAKDPDFPDDWTTPSHTYIHRTLTSSELPSRPTMLSIVEAFIELGRIQNGRQVIDKIEMLWTAAFEHRVSAVPQLAEATPPTADSPAGPSDETEAAAMLVGEPEWSILPMSDEPPLTLLMDKEETVLPVGTEVDRFGAPENGNMTYAAGTPFEHRSLIPAWADRPYHAYRVALPLPTLRGTAIPWFNQPGGGTAYFFASPIAELVASGSLIEIDEVVPPAPGAQGPVSDSAIKAPEGLAMPIYAPASGRHSLREEQPRPHSEPVPLGPLGPGSAMPGPGGRRPSEEFRVKASLTALKYCTEDDKQFDRMVPELWFASVEDAERVGFRPLR